MSDILLNYNLKEVETVLLSMSQPKYRAKQIYKWLHSGVDFTGMSDIPVALREQLSSGYVAQPITIIDKFVSKDGTVKFLYKLNDGNIIEGVFMKYKHGNTLCVSTQIGCRMHCAFCASGLDGLIRNLSAGEILGQVTAVNSHMGGTIDSRAVTNIVLMGSGEPLDNYDNVVKFIDLVSNPDGINISQRNISLSTCGLADKMKQLCDSGLNINLTVSLHATTDEQRAEIIPAARKFSISDITDAVRYYFNRTGRRILFEYILIKGFNHSNDDAVRLRKILSGISSHVNLIVLNHVKEKNIKGATRLEAEMFLQALENQGISATIRRSMGADIEGACGQLRNQYVGQKTPVSSGQKPE